MTMHRSILAGALAIAVIYGMFVPSNNLAAEPGQATSILEQSFASPNDADKPWAYWWWINGNVDKPTITHELIESLKKSTGPHIGTHAGVAPDADEIQD